MKNWFGIANQKFVRTSGLVKLLAGGVIAAAMGLVSPAQASLTTSFSFVGDVAASTGGCGTENDGSNTCSFNESVPTGSTVLGAYLYSSLIPGGSAPGGTLDGSTVNYSTALGTNSAGLEAYRSDVTGIVQAAVGGGAASPFTFTVTETNTETQDGEALVIVYSNGAITTTQSIGILDGFSQTGGDSATINFTNPLTPTSAGFNARMSIGDGFSYDGSPCGSDPSQFSNIFVSTGGGGTPTPETLLTDGAGCNDNSVDASPANGNLITVGDINAACPPALNTGNEAADVANDHENYCLNSLISDGNTQITTFTNNPSNNDNIFLEVFAITGSAGFNAPAPPAGPDVPEPASLALFGAGLFGLAIVKRRKRA